MDGDTGINLDEVYPAIRAGHEARYPPDEVGRLRTLASSLRSEDYDLAPQMVEDIPYDVNDCPPTPPEDYPHSWPTIDILQNWNPNDYLSHASAAAPHAIYQGICRFDAATEYDKALAYRNAEVPFVIRDDPVVLPAVERWNRPDYLTNVLGHERLYRTDVSTTNRLLFYNNNGAKKSVLEGGWEAPTWETMMPYPDWLTKANNPNASELQPDQPHWYFKLDGKSRSRRDHYLFDELPFFNPTNPNFYMVDPPADGRGEINCLFGMAGTTAQNHFDASRNFVAVLGGRRRYIISHPDQCGHLALHPMGHPSARHSMVDWSNPDLAKFPQFEQARSSEVVLQAGDVLYLPTNWFHFIVSLDTSWQCNARSGVTQETMGYILDCGFGAVAPRPIRELLLGKKR